MGKLPLLVLPLSITFLICPLCVRSQSGEPGSNRTFELQLTVRQVPVDVIVLDSSGNEVRGLKKDDFIVSEDGKKQRIESFDWFDGSATSFKPPALAPLPPNTFVNIPQVAERGPLYVLYYDMVNTSEDDQMTLRGQLLHFIDAAPSGVRIALFVNANGLHLIQGFTTDRDQLRQALLQKGSGPHVPHVFIFSSLYGRGDAGAALSNLTFIAHYLQDMPGRKNLLWMSSSFPIPVSPALGGVGVRGAPLGPDVLDLSSLLNEAIEQTYYALMRSQVALYPVSVSGVIGGAQALVQYDQMRMIAAATGGQAYYSSNYVKSLLDRAIDEGQTYYTLTYTPSNTKYDGSERHIQVQLRRRGHYSLAYRTVYCALRDNDFSRPESNVAQEHPGARQEADTLGADMEHGAPMLHDVLFLLHLRKIGTPQKATPEQMRALEDSSSYFRVRAKDRKKANAPLKLQDYGIDYDILDPRIRSAVANDSQGIALEFVAAAYGDDGQLLNSILNRAIISRDTNGRKGDFYRAVQHLEVPPGTSSLRVAVRDISTSRTGTLEVALPLEADGAAQVAGGWAGGLVKNHEKGD